ncbi:hypothetical protein F5I97DRAFT_538495 [Phlebopus sp. FC_14]|nr:hypothetical protein F5I97DRAFT_538495 [Phlebopus sp. FC_14]
MPSESSVFAEHDIHDIAVFAAQISSDLPSLDSSLTSSPEISTPDSLSSSSVLSSTCLSRQHTVTVKFAPLPQTDPDRKRSIAPLGVSARSRRRRVRRERGTPLWSADPDVPEGMLEDPLITFGRFVKNTSISLWRRVRKKSVVSSADEHEHAGGAAQTKPGERRAEALAVSAELKGELGRILRGEEKPTRRASWSPSTERGTLSSIDDRCHRLRRSTGDLPLPRSSL